ncbi:Ribokinase-like protein [Russula compacta]|nr:Ribokinase-like protein [Russula compacta]
MSDASSEQGHEYALVCMGNPLLDIQLTNGEKLFEKYNLNANDLILAEEKHLPIYDEIVKEQKVVYLAGGASQNAARGAAYVLPPNSVVYTGCVGDDDFAEQLREANRREGLAEAYLVKEGGQTGVCAVIITSQGHDRYADLSTSQATLNIEHSCFPFRSFVVALRAAEKFDKAHLATPRVARLIDGAKFFYVDGYFLTHGLESTLEVAKNASDNGKVFAINLNAPFIPQFFKVQLEQVFPHCDFVIGNESEAAAWANVAGLPDTGDIPAIAKSIAMLPKSNSSRPRTVIVTQGPNPTVVVTAADPDKPKNFPVDRLDDRQIVDTNGAGDAFAGGFLGALVSGKSVDEAVLVGHKLGAMCVQLAGSQYLWPKVAVL